MQNYKDGTVVKYNGLEWTVKSALKYDGAIKYMYTIERLGVTVTVSESMLNSERY